MKFFRNLVTKFLLKIEPYLPPRQLIIVQGDTLPAKMPIRSLVLTRDGREDWCVGFQCPCGCGRTIQLLVIEEANPRWSYKVNLAGQPSLHPSVWLNNGCRSHFWVKDGRIKWV